MPVGVALILIGAAALVVRRRWPTLTFVIAWCVGFSAVFAPDMQPVGILFVALYGVAVAAHRYGAVLALVATLGVLGVSVVNSSPVGTTHWGSWVIAVVVSDVVLPVAVWSFGRFRYRSLARIRDLRREHDQALEIARRDERLMLSHELHDIVSHTVNVMTLQAAGARAIMDLDPSKVGPSLEIIERAGVQAMNELQRLLGVLRADGTDQTTATQPQLSDLPQLLETARSSGQTVELAINGSPGELDPSVELACYRIVQEALTNARKYAGTSAQVAVGMEWIPPQLVLTVRNAAGAASDQAVLSTGNGLAGLSERVRLVGGRLETEELSTGGFVVRATLPVASMRTAVVEAVSTQG
ncbi:two-component sensor histidine kinase [Microlunatus endophyticus]|uniref:histidine kinase n=1 Tax=Microlunatus endophyticus TaxID=1716077 RepID=A0A917W560_9ACTN|nr:histidine kinase [Microlunatus endophyticus]GGL63972.1 two-component sensor histidine kinase [Microlunatus endophyticus]